MIFKSFSLFLVFLTIQNVYGVFFQEDIDMAEYNTSYYNPTTGLALKAELENSSREQATRIIFRGLPCDCSNLSCSCCAGVNLTAIKFNRRACTYFSYDPQEFSVDMSLNMNEREIYKNAFSAKNPPPLCTPFSSFSPVSFCVRFYDIYMPGRNFHTCIDFETRIVGSPVLIMHFDCVNIGLDGISLTKPEDHSYTTPKISEPEVYDEVNFAPEEDLFNSTSNLSSEDDIHIGQLKL